MGNYSSEARSALDLTGKIIGEFGPRLAGSPACLGAADALGREAAIPADHAGTEDFWVHPGAFLGFIRLLVVLYLCAAIILPLASWVSALLASLGLIVLVFGFILYHGLLDPFWPAVKGRNVSATLEPQGKVERVLIVSGHHDSARVFNFYVDRPELYARRVYGGIGAFLAICAASLILAMAAPPQAVLVVAADSGRSSQSEAISFLTGGTDAAEPAKAGVEATTIIAMKWSNSSRLSAYPTPSDTVNAIEPEAIEAAIAIAVRLAERLDEGEGRVVHR